MHHDSDSKPKSHSGKNGKAHDDDAPLGSLHDTPLRPDAFQLDDDLKKELIADHMRSIMLVLGLDLDDDSLKGTPERVARMYVDEIFSGLDPRRKPKISLFANKYKYGQMLVVRDITVTSFCEHHFVPFMGKAHVAYISSGKVIGLSKLNRIVQYFAKRPQVQERLTVQIADAMKEALDTQDVAVLVDATHLCVQARGVQDMQSSTVTSEYCGRFMDTAVRNEFLNYIAR